MIASALSGQSQTAAPIIIGSVRGAGPDSVLPYSVVSVGSLGRQQFTTDHGDFVLRDLPPGSVTLRIRHLGFEARDTTVQLHAGDTLRLRLSLTRLVINLDAIHVVGAPHVQLARGCPVASDAAEQTALILLLDQVVQNAEQYRLLVKAHPFALRFSEATVVRRRDGTIVEDPKSIPGPDPYDHFVILASAKPVYHPGKIFRSVRGADEVFVPELQDLADSVFIARHCFFYGGDTVVDSIRFLRVTFAPAGEVKDADIEGTVTLRAAGYGLVAIEMRTTGDIPRKFVRNIASVVVMTRFREVIPGVAVLSHLESFLQPGADALRNDPGVASKGEIESLLGISWVKGPP